MQDEHRKYRERGHLQLDGWMMNGSPPNSMNNTAKSSDEWTNLVEKDDILRRKKQKYCEFGAIPSFL